MCFLPTLTSILSLHIETKRLVYITNITNIAAIMPRRCVAAAGCNTASGQGYSLHEFPRDDGVRSKWAQAVKLHRVGWNGPTATSCLCSKHFEPDCFITEGVRFRDAVGIPAKKRLKPNAIPTIFPRSSDSVSSHLTTPLLRPASERQKRKAVSIYISGFHYRVIYQYSYIEHLKAYANHLSGVQVMTTISLQCNSLSQIHSSAYFRLKIV